MLKLKQILRQRKYDFYLLPRTDEYFDTDLGYSLDRFRQITNFTGSNANCIVSQGKGIFVTDSRYELQVKSEIDHAEWEVITTNTPLKDLVKGKTVVIDSLLFSQSQIASLKQACGKLIVNNDQPLVDSVLCAPSKQQVSLFDHGVEYSGESTESKLARVRAVMESQKLDHLHVSMLEEISWLLNKRATGVREFSPLFNAQLVIGKSDLTLFTDHSIQIDGCQVLPVSHFGAWVDKIDGSVGVDPLSISGYYYNKYAKVIETNFPILSQMKIIKNQVELNGLEQALIKESAVLIQFYSQIKQLVQDGGFKESDGELMLHNLRQQQSGYLGPSFPAIIGAGPNGAIVHYRPKAETAIRVNNPRTNLLIDTGAHYIDGTTDTTRTMVFEQCRDLELKEMYTRVLMGNLDLEGLRFPKGKYGHQLESFARRWLWQVGLDFGHGVGHGVSHVGPVHEYPHYAYSKPPTGIPLEQGMVITNEPGFYKPNQYGIRIENILTVTSVENSLGFKNLTKVPYCKELIVKEILMPYHLAQIRSYYDQIEREVKVTGSAKDYLNQQLDL